jgi:uncharacterized protein YcbX
MRVRRIGVTPIKGTRHQARAEIELAPSGPVGDRVFGLVDLERRQVLRTVATGSLLAVAASWQHGRLTVNLGGTEVTGLPRATGATAGVEYWGRQITGEIVDGPWSAAFSEYLNRPVVLTANRVGDIVYGDSVSIITTGSLTALRLGAESHPFPHPAVDSARFRATFVIDTAGSRYAEPSAERSWIGQDLILGSARVRVTGAIVRCAVVDLNPLTGQRDLRLLSRLPRNAAGEPVFGLQGKVVQPGRVYTEEMVTVRQPSRPAGSDQD